MSIADKLVIIAENEQKVYDAGKQAEHYAFWDTYQNGGKSVSGEYQFYSVRFDDTNFYPIYDMKPTNAKYMFANSRITKLKERLEECGVSLDTSVATSFESAFYYCRSPILPEISTVGASTLLNTFIGTYLVTIEKLILKNDGSQTFSGTFTDCTNLENIAIEGTIGQSINFKSCPLSYESLMDEDYGILHHLKDYSGTSTTKTLTLSTTSKGYLSDAEKAIATDKGWTIA